MKQKLIDFLVCPTCRHSINIKIKKKIRKEIIEGTIICDHCKDNFKITNGIPRFVVDQTKDFVKTEAAFSSKWQKHHKNHQEKDWVDFQRKWFLDRYGWKTVENFELQEILRENAYNFILENFTWEKLLPKYIKFYNNLFND